MYCSRCGKQLNEDVKFCTYCGNSIEKDILIRESNKTEQPGIPAENTVLAEQTDKKKSSLGRKLYICVWVVIWLVVIVGVFWCARVILEKNKLEQEERKETAIHHTLRKLGGRSFGSNDFNTAQYSMALSFFEDAALGESAYSHLLEADEEEVKRDSFESLEKYFERDYEKTYAALIFCADYFDKEDVEYFYDGTKVNVYKLNEHVEDIMFRNQISMSALLVNKEDEKICSTLSLRIRLAEDGYIKTEDIVSELYEFVYGGVGVRTVDEELLAEGISYDEFIDDAEGAFSGEKVYYNDLSPVGKMVFLYLMPRCIVQFDQEAGSELWYYHFESLYNALWNEIINRDIFENIIEF